MSPIPYSLAVGSWLPGSETFIYDQLLRAERYLPSVLARDLLPSRTAFPFERVSALSPIELAAYYTLFWSPKFERALRQSNAQLIHAHFGTNGALIAQTAKKLNLPLVTTLHGIDVGILLGKIPAAYWFYARSYKEMFTRSQLLLPASQELADRLVELGADPAKIEIHRLGVDLSQLKAVDRPDRPLSILMIGRLVEKKGFEYAIRAFGKIADRLPESRLILVGDGPLRQQLEQVAYECGVANRLVFKGVQSRQEVQQLLEECDILVGPSVVAANNDRDSGLIVLKEAGATAMATIGTDCGGLPEIIDSGTTGYIVGQREVDSLAEAMEALGSDYALRQRMGVAARQKMEKEYDAVVQNRRLETLFDRVM